LVAASNDDIKLYQVVHGANGILGEGSWKIAKYMADIETGDKIVKSKFKKFTASEIEAKFPELIEIAQLTRGMPYVTEIHYLTMSSLSGKTYSFIISDFAKSDLKKVIEKGGLTDEVKMKYAFQLLAGLAALQTKKIAHRDIKPANINIIEDSKTDESSANLADLDFATREDKPSKKGTALYMAPEIARSEYNKIEDLLKGDIYGLGMTLYVLFNGKHLWYDRALPKESVSFHHKLNLMSVAEMLAQFPEPSTNTIDHLLWEMMHPDPYKRPSAEEAKQKLISLGAGCFSKNKEAIEENEPF
jgi:serine/threonine protein kinase